MLEFNTWVIVFVPTIMVLLIILAAVVYGDVSLADIGRSYGVSHSTISKLE